MVTFVNQPAFRAPDQTADLAGLGRNVAAAIDAHVLATDRAKIADLVKSGASTEEIARQTAQSRNPELAQLGLRMQQRASERAEDVGFRERQFQSQQKASAAAAGLAREKFDFMKKAKTAELVLKKLETEFKRSGFESAKDKADVEEGLRKEFSKLSGEFIKVRDSFRRVQASGSDAAGDLSLVFNFMKMLDPGSVVRETEFANAQNAAGVSDRVRARWNQLRAGEILTEGQRKEFRDQAGKLFKQQFKQHSQLRDQYRGIGERMNIDTRNVLVDFSSSNLVEPPQAAVDFLKQNADSQEVKADFAAKYGIAALDKFMGAE